MKNNGQPKEPKPVNQILRLLPLLNDRDLRQVKKEIDKISIKRALPIKPRPKDSPAGPKPKE